MFRYMYIFYIYCGWSSCSTSILSVIVTLYIVVELGEHNCIADRPLLISCRIVPAVIDKLNVVELKIVEPYF